jgi:hypothetical protein
MPASSNCCTLPKTNDDRITRHAFCGLVVIEFGDEAARAQFELGIEPQGRQQRRIGRGLGIGFAGDAVAVAAIFAGAERHAFGVDVRRTGDRHRRRERMIAETLRCRAIHQSGVARFDRRIRIFVAARSFEYIAAVDLLAAQIAGLSRHAANLVEEVIGRFKLVIADRPVLDRHVVRDRLRAIAFGERRADAEVGRQKTPVQGAPMDARAADAFARQKRADAADRQRLIVRKIAEGQRVDRIVHHQFEALRIAHFVADRRQDEILTRDAVGTSLKGNDAQSGFGQFARHDRAGPTEANRERIDLF